MLYKKKSWGGFLILEDNSSSYLNYHWDAKAATEKGEEDTGPNNQFIIKLVDERLVVDQKEFDNI